jgi:Beta-xylosidase
MQQNISMKKVLFTLLAGSMFCLNIVGQKKNTFINPVIAQDLADPSIIRIGKDYYVTGTSSEWAPFYPIYKSTDLVNWKQIGHAFDEKPEWTTNSFWAPELYQLNGKTYLYYTARRKSDNKSYIGVAIADSPESEFKDFGPIIIHGNEAIDAFVIEEKGQLYISWKAYGLDQRPIEILMSKLSSDGLTLEGEPVTLLKDVKGVGIEGQCMFKRGDYFYILYSENGCCGPSSDYAVCIARSKEVTGPYEIYSNNPILHGGNKDFLSCGHGTMVTLPDSRMYYICHAYQEGERFYNGRQPILQEMVINNDNWVEFVNESNKEDKSFPSLTHTLPFKGKKQNSQKEFVDNFNSKTLNVEWTWNYPYSDVSTEIKGGKLYLTGESKGNYPENSVLCLRPSFSNYTVETKLSTTTNPHKGWQYMVII